MTVLSCYDERPCSILPNKETPASEGTVDLPAHLAQYEHCSTPTLTLASLDSEKQITGHPLQSLVLAYSLTRSHALSPSYALSKNHSSSPSLHHSSLSEPHLQDFFSTTCALSTNHSSSPAPTPTSLLPVELTHSLTHSLTPCRAHALAHAIAHSLSSALASRSRSRHSASPFSPLAHPMYPLPPFYPTLKPPSISLTHTTLHFILLHPSHAHLFCCVDDG